MHFQVFLLILLTSFVFANISYTNCGSDNDPATLTYFSYLPADSFVIDSIFSYVANYSIKTGYEISAGSTLHLAVWYQNFSADPIIEMDFDSCEIFSCPVVAGNYVRKDYDIKVPEFPIGKYKIELLLRDDQGSRLACYDFEASMSNGSSPTPANCVYTSSYTFSTTVAQGQAHYQNEAPADRNIGDWMQIGNMSSHGTFPLISFSKLDSTPDNTFGETLEPSNFQWAINATYNTDNSNSNEYIFEYSGDFWMGSLQLGMTTWDNCFMKGTVEFTETYSKSTNELTGAYGQVNVIPPTSYPHYWAGPISFGKLNPAKMEFNIQLRAAAITATGEFCQCEVDICGVCGGDGSSCQSPTSTSESTSKVGVIVPAVVVPIVVVGAIIFVVIYRRKKKQKEIRDSVMNPNIPSYNTSDWTRIGDIN
eukprot:Anaeramoba_ignava/c21541_g1_i2.p1 GENE.c21541_g1_i2~~c21541_g1_i2.p1  ORF type:complete len:430 (+),score=120.71 c21541_g1_i2:27-1292(+)